MTSGTHALILAQSAFEAVCKERDEALALLASEKSTRNAIIAKGVEMEKQIEAMREAIKEAHEALNVSTTFGTTSRQDQVRVKLLPFLKP